GERPGAAREARKIVVVSDDPHRPPDRWVDRPIALAGRAQGRGDGVGEQSAHGNGPTLVRVYGGELAVRAEAAVREIDGTKRVVDGCGGRPECGGAADEHMHGCAKRAPAGHGDLHHDRVCRADPFGTVTTERGAARGSPPRWRGKGRGSSVAPTRARSPRPRPAAG